jgi:hypothetical protein
MTLSSGFPFLAVADVGGWLLVGILLMFIVVAAILRKTESSEADASSEDKETSQEGSLREPDRVGAGPRWPSDPDQVVSRRQARLEEARQEREKAADAFAQDDIEFAVLKKLREEEEEARKAYDEAVEWREEVEKQQEALAQAQEELREARQERQRQAEEHADGKTDFQALEQAVEREKSIEEKIQSLGKPPSLNPWGRDRPEDEETAADQTHPEGPGSTPASTTGDGDPGKGQAATVIPERTPTDREVAAEASRGFWGRLTDVGKVAFLSAIGVVVGGLGPWVDVLVKTGYGAQGDGWFIAVPALVILFLLARRERTPGGWMALLFASVGGVTTWKISDLLGIEMFGERIGWKLMSWGLPVALAASLVGLLASLYLLRRSDSSGVRRTR